MRAIHAVVTAFVLLLFGGLLGGLAFADDAPPPSGAAAAASTTDKPEKRLAFVVGNESYAAGALPTAANDAGLVAQTLQAAGFEVVGARDLDAETLRRSYGDFLKRVGEAGPDTVAFVYMAGYGLQYGNSNFFVPIGASVSRDADIPIETIRLADLTGPLVAMNLKARFMVFDAAYRTPFKTDGAALAGGFSLVDAGPGTLFAYNAAPGTVASPGKGNYGVYAQSLAAMLREGGLPPDEIFDRVRLRVNDETKGAVVPWDSSKIDTDFRFFDRAKDAPAATVSAEQVSALTEKPLKDLPVREAYTAAVARDTVQSYAEFTSLYHADPLAKRARVLLAARREALTWRRTISVDTPAAYWSYLDRYPRGPHAADSRVRLQDLSAASAPPSDFSAIAYDVPPPPPEELPFVDQPVVSFDDPAYDFPPPPPPPDYWLPPVPVAFLDLPPPPPPLGLFFLPVPAFVPLPVYYNPPPFVAFPVGNFFYGGFGGGFGYGFGGGYGYGGGGFNEVNINRTTINNTTVVNNIHSSFPAQGPRDANGQVHPTVGLPSATQASARSLEGRGIKTQADLNAARSRPGGLDGAARQGANGRGGPAERNALPGADGRPLPAAGREAPRGGDARNGGEKGRAGEAGRADDKGRRGEADRGGVAKGAANGRPGAADRGGAAKGAADAKRIEAGKGEKNAADARRAGRAERNASDRRGGAKNGRGEANRAADRRADRAATRRGGAERGAATRAERRGPEQQRQQRAVEDRGQRGPGRGGEGPRGQARQEVRQPQQARGPQRQVGGFGGGGERPGGFGGGGRPAFGGGARPGGFGGGPAGFGGGGARPGGFGGGGGGGGRPGGFGGGGGGGRPAGGGGGGGGRPAGGGGGGGHPGAGGFRH